MCAFLQASTEYDSDCLSQTDRYIIYLGRVIDLSWSDRWREHNALRGEFYIMTSTWGDLVGRFPDDGPAGVWMCFKATLIYVKWNEMNRALGHLCAHIG